MKQRRLLPDWVNSYEAVSDLYIFIVRLGVSFSSWDWSGLPVQRLHDRVRVIGADLAGAVGASAPKGKGSVGACTQRKN